jgi:prolyl oligopeptidase
MSQADMTQADITPASHSLVYPPSPKVDQVDDYHGVEVADPYRWLEDPDSDESRQWIEAQNQVTFTYLNDIPVRESLKQRLTQLWNYEKYGIPFKRENRYFYFKNDGLQNQSVLYTLPKLDAEPRVLLDPNTLSEDGTVALSGLAISEDARLMAYGLSTSGSDWQEWKVRDVETGEDLPDHLKWIKFGRRLDSRRQGLLLLTL